MRVELTGERLHGVRMAIRGTPWEERVEELLPAPLEGRGKKVEFWMPPAAWVRVRDCLQDRCFTTKGFRDQDIPPSMLKALQVVSKAVNGRARHPAFRGKSITGWSPLCLPAWVHLEDGHYEWALIDCESSPYAFVYMVPEHSSWRGMRITSWNPRVGLPPGADVLEPFDESLHLRFMRE